MNFKLVIVLILTSTIVCGCSSSYKNPVTESYKGSIHKVKLASLIRQQEIEARVDYNNSILIGMHFGLIGALLATAIDSEINTDLIGKKEEQILPLRNALIDLDFNSLIHQSYTKTLSKVEWLDIAKAEYVEKLNDIELPDNELILFVSSSYKLNENFTAVEVISNVALTKIQRVNSRHGKKDKFNNEEIFNNTYVYLSPAKELAVKTPLIVENEKNELQQWYTKERAEIEKIPAKYLRELRLKALRALKKEKLAMIRPVYSNHKLKMVMAELWAQDDAKLLKSYLKESIVELSRLMLSDISDTVPTYKHLSDKTVTRIGKRKDKYQLISKGESRSTVRVLKGEYAGVLCSIPNNENPYKCIEQQ
jgi:hypothetical protein